MCAPLSRWTARLSPCPPCAPSGAHGTKCPRVCVHTCWQAPGRAWCWGRAGTWPRQACPLAGLDRAPRPPWEARACSGQPKTVTRATRSPGRHLFALLLGWPWVRSGCGVSEGPWPSAWSGGFGLSTLGFCPAGGATHALGDARGARWGRGARGHCPCSSVPPRGSGPPQHAPGAWGKTSASCTSGPQGALRTAVPGCWEDGHPAWGPAITSALSWLHDERQWLSVSPRKGPLSLPVPLGAEIKCPPLHGPGHPIRVGRGLPAGDTGTAWAGCHSPGRASPRQPGGWAKRPWNEVVAEAGSWDKGRVLWDGPLEDRSYVTQRL